MLTPFEQMLFIVLASLAVAATVSAFMDMGTQLNFGCMNLW